GKKIPIRDIGFRGRILPYTPPSKRALKDLRRQLRRKTVRKRRPTRSRRPQMSRRQVRSNRARAASARRAPSRSRGALVRTRGGGPRSAVRRRAGRRR
ncbi:hypothetical protein LCGC14_3051530, partial [marine sediment metagenome]